MIGKSQIRPPPPPSNEQRAIAPALCQKLDPRMTPPFTGYAYKAIQKSVLFIERPPPYRNNMLLRFATTFFLILLFTFLEKKMVPPLSSPSYATKFVYLPIVKYIQAHIPTRRV